MPEETGEGTTGGLEATNNVTVSAEPAKPRRGRPRKVKVERKPRARQIQEQALAKMRME